VLTPRAASPAARRGERSIQRWNPRAGTVSGSGARYSPREIGLRTIARLTSRAMSVSAFDAVESAVKIGVMHMRRAYRSALLGLAVVPLGAIACSDSTSPSSIAHHMDSLYRQACARAYNPQSGYANGAGYDTASVYWQRCLLLSVLVAAPASGVELSPVTVTTGAGTGTWQAVVINEFDSGGGHYLTSNTDLIAYSDANVTNVVEATELQYYGSSGGGFDAFIIANDTIIENGSFTTTTGSVTTKTLGSRCHDTSGLSDPLAYYGFPPVEYGPSICQLGTFEGSVTASFPATTGLDPNLESFTIAPQTINGISVVPGRFYLSRVGTARWVSNK